MRRDGCRASARSSAAATGKSASEKTCALMPAKASSAPGTSNAMTIAAPASVAPLRRMSRPSTAIPVATARTWAARRPRSPNAAKRPWNVSSDSTGTLGQLPEEAAANGMPCGIPPRSTTTRPSAASQRASGTIVAVSAVAAAAKTTASDVHRSRTAEARAARSRTPIAAAEWKLPAVSAAPLQVHADAADRDHMHPGPVIR